MRTIDLLVPSLLITIKVEVDLKFFRIWKHNSANNKVLLRMGLSDIAYWSWNIHSLAEIRKDNIL